MFQITCKDAECMLLILDTITDASVHAMSVCLRCWTYSQADDFFAQEISCTMPPWMWAAEASRQLMTHLKALLLLLLSGIHSSEDSVICISFPCG